MDKEMVREWQRGYEIANEFTLEEERKRTYAERLHGMLQLQKVLQVMNRLPPREPSEERFIYVYSKARNLSWEAMKKSELANDNLLEKGSLPFIGGETL